MARTTQEYLARLDAYERQAVRWMHAHSILVMRISLGVVFFWFGVLKFFPGRSPAEALAAETMSAITFHTVPQSVSLPLLAVLECTIGIGLAFGVFTRQILLLMAVQMSGTFLPLVLFPHETWRTFGTTPTLEGQYIIKNLVLISGGLIIGATLNGSRPFDRGTPVVEPQRVPGTAQEVSGYVPARRVVTDGSAAEALLRPRITQGGHLRRLLGLAYHTVPALDRRRTRGAGAAL